MEGVRYARTARQAGADQRRHQRDRAGGRAPVPAGGVERLHRGALCPGYISTPLNAAIAAGIGGDEFEREYARQRIPLGRTGQPEEVAAAYAFLASDDASFIHGTGLVIDGGQLAVM
jgi:NAD(P)-dependent dehydrogenase (short-subunit alcohol dehydrogenase family)